MQKWSALLIVSALVTAHALPPADCGKYMSIGTSSLSYTSKAQFPNESERIDVDFEQGANAGKTVSICGVTFKPDTKNDTVTITTSQFSNFFPLFKRHSKDPKALYLDNGYKSAHSSFMGPVTYTIFDPNKLTLTYEPPQYELAPVTIGVKVNNGPIRPVYFNGKAEAIRIPKTARVVDIYTKAGQGDYLSWQRMKIDLKSNMIQIYKKAAFPTK